MRRLHWAGRAAPEGSGDPLRGVVGQRVSAPAGATYEDFTTYTEVDPSSNISIATNVITTTTVDSRNVSAYVYDDKTAGHFSGDFTHKFKITYSGASAGSVIRYWMLANAVGDLKALNDASEDSIGFGHYGTELRLEVTANGSGTNDAYETSSASGTYYITIVRDDDGGVNSTGRVTAEIRTGSHTGTLVDTLQVDCAVGEQNDYRYIYAFNTYNNANANFFISSTTEYMELNE